MRQRCIGLCVIVACLVPLPCAADSATPATAIAGWVEKITMLPAGVVTKAKLDTGAKTSSINARNIERFKREGETWVRFDLDLGQPELNEALIGIERPLSRRVLIKDHDDENDRRVVIELEFCMDGRKRKAEFSLADRSKFIYPVLLGRRFLSGVAVIDPAQTFLTQAHCEDRS